MDKLKLFFLFFPAAIFAQYEEPQKVDVYQYQNGIKDLLPTRVLEIREDRIDVYNYQFGVQELFPQKTMEVKTEIQVFEVKDGIRDLFPLQVIFKNVDNVHQLYPIEQPSNNPF